MTTSGTPAVTVSPTRTVTLWTFPASSETTACSIFIDSRTRSSSPGVTGSPTLTAMLMTVPVNGAHTATFSSAVMCFGGFAPQGQCAYGVTPAGSCHLGCTRARLPVRPPGANDGPADDQRDTGAGRHLRALRRARGSGPCAACEVFAVH